MQGMQLTDSTPGPGLLVLRAADNNEICEYTMNQSKAKRGKQESLADAKVSARQQCVYELEDPYRRNLQQICN